MKRNSSSSSPLVRATFCAALSATSLMACQSFERSHGSGYAYRDSTLDQGLSYREDRAIYFREQTVDEMGFENSGSLNENQQAALNLRMQLKEAERDIVGRREREQYFRHKPLMQSDRERLEFLRISTFENRARWLAARGISAVNPHHTPAIQKLIEQNDITLGMTKQAVRESWGEPEIVEVAGNPIYGNERWKYLEEVSSPEGYQTETRILFFEAGRVAGWEKH